MARSVAPDPELAGHPERRAGVDGGGGRTVGRHPAPGGDGEVPGGLLVTVPDDWDDGRRASLDQLAAHAGAPLERHER